MPNKRTGEDYLDRKPRTTLVKKKETPKKKFDIKAEQQRVKKLKDDHWNSLDQETKDYINAQKKPKNAVLKGKPGKIKPIGTAKGKAKLTPLKKKKK